MAGKLPTYSEFAKKAILTHIKNITDLENGTKFSPDIEYLHKMRVENRRLANTLWLFKNIFSKKELDIWRKKIKITAQTLGQARDLDTQIEFLKTFKVKYPRYSLGLDTLIDLFKQNRKTLQPQVISTLDEFNKTKVFANIKNELNAIKIKDKSLYKKANKKINKRLAQLLGYEKFIDNPKDTKNIHKMRIAAKHLRYSLETFKPLKEETLERLITIIRKIQASLGEIHTFDLWLKALPILYQQNRDNKIVKSAINYFLKKAQVKRKTSYAKFIKYWNKLKKDSLWQEVSESF